MAVAERITASNELAWKKDVALVLMGNLRSLDLMEPSTGAIVFN
jgi:hypothetical protein